MLPQTKSHPDEKARHFYILFTWYVHPTVWAIKIGKKVLKKAQLDTLWHASFLSDVLTHMLCGLHMLSSASKEMWLTKFTREPELPVHTILNKSLFNVNYLQTLFYAPVFDTEIKQKTPPYSFDQVNIAANPKINNFLICMCVGHMII